MDSILRIVPANRVDNSRVVSNSANLGSTLVSSSRQPPQHNQLTQHQLSHISSQSSSTSSSNSSTHTLTSSQSQVTHSTTPNPSQTRAVSLPLTSSTSVSQGTTTSGTYSKPLHHHTLSRTMSRKEQLKKFMKKEAKEFFGLDDESESKQKSKWEDKRRRLASRKYGPLRDGALSASYDSFSCNDRTAQQQQQETLHFHSRIPQSFSSDFHALHDVPEGRAGNYMGDSVDANSWPRPPPNHAKDSVAKMTWDGLAYTVSKRRAKSQASGTPGGRSKSRSYAPASVSLPDDALEEPLDVSPTTTATTATTATPAALAVASSSVSGSNSNARLTPVMESLENEVFFDGKISGSPETEGNVGSFESSTKEVGSSASRYHPSVLGQWKLADVVQQVTSAGQTEADGGSGRGSARIGRCRIWRRILDHCFDNSDRRQYGMGLFGNLYLSLIPRLKRIKERVMSYLLLKIFNERIKKVRKQLDEIEDYRPYFTWWVTTVQVFILFLSILCYGLAPHGVSLRQQQGEVLMPSLATDKVDYWEPENLWIGPRAADLIHLGAKFAPCMRKDEKIFRHIEEQRRAERETGCCIRNDDSGCVQSSRRECSSRLSVWKKWSELAKGPDGRLSGSVCGQDPNYCKEPASVPPHEWPDDITQWPICKKRVAVSAVRKINAAEHMACEVIGHPCCIGIHGECSITTREYCNFVRGYFHEEATLCSQFSSPPTFCGLGSVSLQLSRTKKNCPITFQQLTKH
ncbi:Inactive rhomboid protein 1 [Armadillidium vulgare]|nr:Inactive rhomboid protein 1 [Armadillidium vulgare]